MLSYDAKDTNLGRVMEIHGPRLLGKLYKDPITSFSTFQKFSVDNPEVIVLTTFTSCYITIALAYHFQAKEKTNVFCSVIGLSA